MTTPGFHLRVVCTDHGTHPTRTLTSISLDDDGLVEDDGRLGQVPWSPQAPIGTAPHSRRMDLVAGGCREEWSGGAKWRFRCPTCREWPPINDAHMRQLFDGFMASDWTVFDISMR